MILIPSYPSSDPTLVFYLFLVTSNPGPQVTKHLSHLAFRDNATDAFRFLDDNRSGRVNRITFAARLQTLHYAGARIKRVCTDVGDWIKLGVTLHSLTTKWGILLFIPRTVYLLLLLLFFLNHRTIVNQHWFKTAYLFNEPGKQI